MVVLQCGVGESGSLQFFSLSDIFPTGSQVYVLAHPYYGCQAEVVNHPEDRVRLKVDVLKDPDLTPALKYNVRQPRLW